MTDTSDDLFQFADEDEGEGGVELRAFSEWRVLIVDDEPQVHTVTRLALDGLRVDGCIVSFDDAYSGDEARQKLATQSYALVLLDVVMAGDDDGLRVVRWLRLEHRDRLTRIVLRTGQPGLAPEREVMLEYDINDYQPKAELSSQRLATSVIGAIRGYRDLRIIQEQKYGLEKIVLATSSLFERRSMEQLVSGVLQQLAALIGPAESAIFFQGVREDGTVETDPVILAGTGRFASAVGRPAHSTLATDRIVEVTRLAAEHTCGSGPDWSLFAMSRKSSEPSRSAAVYLEPASTLDDWQRHLLELFCANAAVAFDNQGLIAEQARLVEAFGRFVPQRMLDAIGIRDITRVVAGEQAQVDLSVMFVDVRSFTPLAERCGARETFRLLNAIFAEIVPIVHQYGGVVDKYVGDGLLSIFSDDGDAPLHAALDMLRAVDRISREEEPRIGGVIDIGIGIHRGLTILGLVGAQDRLEPTVISDAVNVASRLERLTRVYGARIIVSASAMAPESSFRSRARLLGHQSVRGKSGPVECYEVFAADSAVLQLHKEHSRPAFEQAVHQLDDGRCGEAMRSFQAILDGYPSDLAAGALAEMARRGCLP